MEIVYSHAAQRMLIVCITKRGDDEMKEDSVRLLREVNEGCKTAMDSFKQIKEFVAEGALAQLIDEYDRQHQEIGLLCKRLLAEAGEEGKEPGAMAKAMMRLMTEFKMMTEQEDSKAAEILLDGCHAGIKSLGRLLRQYPTAGLEEKSIAERLIDIELDLYKKLLAFL
ncbi:hypothetical protein ACDL92_02015 [Ihubacter sp. mB4P-1]